VHVIGTTGLSVDEISRKIICFPLHGQLLSSKAT
jgi:hypothetical protein